MSQHEQHIADKALQLPFIDYVLVYKTEDITLQTPRDLFEKEMVKDGLQLKITRIDHLTFVKIFCPFDRLALQAERCAIPNPVIPRWRRFVNLLTTDNEIDYVSAPYVTDKAHVFEGADNHEMFFRSATRSFLVHNILINLNIHGQLMAEHVEFSYNEDDVDLMKRGLLFLLMKGAFIDSFVLHDASIISNYMNDLREMDGQRFKIKADEITYDARLELDSTWTKFFKFQPLWKIRNYFGEKIAFYFAWQGTFITVLWIPAIVGILLFVHALVDSAGNAESSTCANVTDTSFVQSSACSNATVSMLEEVHHVLRDSFDTVYSAFFAMVICWWGILFLEIWKRNNYTLAYKWDCDDFESTEPDRPEYFGTEKREDPITGELSWNYPLWRRLRKFMVSATFVSLFVCMVLISVTLVILFKLEMRLAFNCNSSAANPNDTIVTQGLRERILCYTFTNFLPTLLNAMSIMFLGRIYEKFARQLTAWENHRTQTDFNDSFIIKLFVFQFANTYMSLFYIAFIRPEEHNLQTNGLFGWGPEYKDTCQRGTCLSLLSLQVLVLMLVKPFPKLFKDFIWPLLMKFKRSLLRRKRQRNSVRHLNDKSVLTRQDSFRKKKCHTLTMREYMKVPVGDFTMGEYTEKVIQFGYIIMFASSFTLSPLIALVVNLIDLRLDARRLLWWNRRSVAHIATDIGMWLPILTFVCHAGVVSNAFIVAFTSNFCTEFFGEGECTTQHRLVIVIVFEHIAIISMTIIRIAVPDRPASVQVAQRRERYQVTKILEQGQVPLKANGSTSTDSTVVGNQTNQSTVRRRRRSVESAVIGETTARGSGETWRTVGGTEYSTRTTSTKLTSDTAKLPRLPTKHRSTATIDIATPHFSRWDKSQRRRMAASKRTIVDDVVLPNVPRHGVFN